MSPPVNAPVKETCGNCRYWLEQPGGGDRGKCRRYPAVPIPSRLNRYSSGEPEFTYNTEFPIMYASGWCGEWVWTKAPRRSEVIQ